MEEDERLHERTVEQTADVPVPQIDEEIVNSVQLMPLQEGLTEVIKPVPQECISKHMDEQFLGVWETIPEHRARSPSGGNCQGDQAFSS